MKRGILLLFLLTCSYFLHAQNASLNGRIADTVNRKNLTHTVISLLRQSDSVLVAFTRSDKEGKFALNRLPAGKFVLMVTHPTYGSYIDKIQLTDSAVSDLGNLIMTPAGKLLEGVVVRSSSGAIRLRGDTVEYKADSFKVGANATVEDLLRVLPGIQVDKDGVIRSQGETVQKVLVDGEEFFGDDPTIATRNLRADAVDRVQAFDKKSDQAAFTGVDDGQKTKTLNLELKADKKNGYFGKLSAGGGLRTNYNNEAMINMFRAKKKFAAFGMMSNTGKTSLSWNDERNFGGGEGQSFGMDEGSMMFYTAYSNDDDDNNNGIPRNWNAGLHFSNKWNKDRNNFNSSYRFAKVNLFNNSFNNTQTILPDTLFFNNQTGRSASFRQRSKANFSYEIMIDSFNTIKFSGNGSFTRSNNNNIFNSVALNAEGAKVNTNDRSTNNNSDQANFNTSMLWKKRFRKKGRTLSLNLDQKYNQTVSDGFLYSISDFFKTGGVLLNSDTIDQRKTTDNYGLSLNTKAVYTEPVGKNSYIEFSYELKNSNSEAKRNSFDKVNGKYESLNPLFSSDFGFRINTHQTGLNYRFAKKKFNYSFGGSVADARWRQTDLVTNKVYKYNFKNFFPRANINFNFSSFKRLGFNYNGNTRQPTLEQIQPLRENADPLNIYVGNPDLKQSFTHNLSASFSSFKVLTEQNVFFNGSFSFTQNAITNSENVDQVGKRTYQAVNVNGNFNGNFYFSYGFKFKPLKANLSIGANGGTNRFRNIVNGLNNTTDNNNIGINMGIYTFKEKKFNMYLNFNSTYNTSRSSIRKEILTRFWTHDISGSATYFLPWKMDIKGSINANFRQRTEQFADNNDAIILNSSLGKRFRKAEDLELRFSVNDMLNQNIGYFRSVSSNQVSEFSNDVIRRYWLLTFTWNFTKNGTPRKVMGDFE